MKDREAFRPRLGVGYTAVAHDISAMLQHRDDDSEPRWPSKADTRPWRSRRIILSSSFRNHDSVLGYWGLGPRRRPHKLSLPSGFGRPPGSCPSLPCATLRHLHERHRRRGARKRTPQRQGAPLGSGMDRKQQNAASSTASVPTLKLEPRNPGASNLDLTQESKTPKLKHRPGSHATPKARSLQLPVYAAL